MNENDMINDYFEEYDQYYSDSVASDPPLVDEQQEPEIILTDSGEEEKPDITKEDLKQILEDIIKSDDEEENEEEKEDIENSKIDSDSSEEVQIIDTITSEQADEIINRLDALYQIMITPEEEVSIFDKPIMEYTVQESLSLFLVFGLLVAIFINVIKKGVPKIWR